MEHDAPHSAALIYGEPTAARAVGVTVDPTLSGPDAWQVLLALHDATSPELQILDGGAFHVLVPGAALEAGSYERAVCDVASA